VVGPWLEGVNPAAAPPDIGGCDPPDSTWEMALELEKKR
jgi:hypothetical protein